MLPSDFPVRRSVCDTSPTQSAFERCFVAHGQSYGLRAQDGELLDRLAARVPLGWHGHAYYQMTGGGRVAIAENELP